MVSKSAFIAGIFFLASCGYHHLPVRTLPGSAGQNPRMVFIAFDGIGYGMMQELKGEGTFRDFGDPVPLIVPFPSATTIGFTGIFKPLDVGAVPGYEVRFYSFRDNRIIGGTPFDIYKIPINYKTYFDSFRHTIFEKSVMYSFPGVAGKQDLLRTERLLTKSDKRILFTYLGGTDGAQHVLGKNRTKRFMVFADRFLRKMKEKYHRKTGEDLQIVLFSDHGFHYDKLTLVTTGEIGRVLRPAGFRITTRLEGPNDVVFVKYGLLSAGVGMTRPENAEKISRLLPKVDGIDLVFWTDGKKVRMVDSREGEAFFEYRWPGAYRYRTVRGDPLDYLPLLKRAAFGDGDWVSDRTWKRLSWDHDYPDAGYRLYDSFFNLVENRATILFSLKPDYQFGSLAALAGTQLKFGHKGTHGGLFRDVTHGFVQTDKRSMDLPEAIRYDDFFRLFLPKVTRAYERRHGKKEIAVPVSHSSPQKP